MSLPTDQELKVLALGPKISAGISVVLCVVTVCHVLFRKMNASVLSRRRCHSVYHRIIMGISLMGIPTGVALFMSTWPIPSSSWEMWASGNDTTCRVQGFFVHWSVGMALYYLSLSFYYLLAVRYSWKEAQLKKWEILFHGVPIGWALGTAIAALYLDILHSATLWCWIGGVDTDKYRMILYYVPIWICMLVVCFNLILVFTHVRKITLCAERHLSRSIFLSSSQWSSAQSMPHDESRANETVDAVQIESVDEANDELYQNQGFVSSLPVPSNAEEEQDEENAKEESVTLPRSSRTLATSSTLPSQQQQEIASAFSFAKRRQDVAMQSLRFAITLIITWLPVSIIRIIQMLENRPVPYWLLVWASFQSPLFLPLFVVYSYPYVRDKLCFRPRR